MRIKANLSWNYLTNYSTVSQIRKVGNQEGGPRHDSDDMAPGRPNILRADIAGAAQASATPNLHRGRSTVSHMRPRSDAHLRRRLQLHILLRAVHSDDRWVVWYMKICVGGKKNVVW